LIKKKTKKFGKSFCLPPPHITVVLFLLSRGENNFIVLDECRGSNEETSRRRITVTSSLNEKSIDLLEKRVMVRGGNDGGWGNTDHPPPFTAGFRNYI
jgi:hypothetical protein